jgi:SAM-dependent methyltransferase
MRATSTRCRTCGADKVKHLGPLAEGWVFAGRRLDTPLQGGELWRCTACGFVFRDPLLSEGRYEALYRTGALDVWDGVQAREDFRLIKRTIAASASGAQCDVLDVGCYTGQFVASLPSTYGIFGIEANEAAARVAASRGVTIIAKTLRDFSAMDGLYDVITACDLIEHVENPLDFLRLFRKHLKPRGKLIITTGNCDAWLWRLSGARFWYCSIPEHISFIGERWTRKLPQTVNLRLTEFITFNHLGGGLNLRRLLPTALYTFSQSIYRGARAALGKEEYELSPPGYGATKDHMLCVFQAE